MMERKTLMSDENIAWLADVTDIPVEKVRTIVDVTERYMREKCTVIDPTVDPAEPLDWDY